MSDEVSVSDKLGRAIAAAGGKPMRIILVDDSGAVYDGLVVGVTVRENQVTVSFSPVAFSISSGKNVAIQVRGMGDLVPGSYAAGPLPGDLQGDIRIRPASHQVT